VSKLQPPLPQTTLPHCSNYRGCCTVSRKYVNVRHSSKSLHVTSSCRRVLPVTQLADNSLRCRCVHLHGWWRANMGTRSSNGHRFHQWARSRQRSSHHGNDSILVVLERLLLHCCQLWHKSEQLQGYPQLHCNKMLSSLKGDLAANWPLYSVSRIIISRCMSSGMWHHVTLRIVPNISEEHTASSALFLDWSWRSRHYSCFQCQNSTSISSVSHPRRLECWAPLPWKPQVQNYHLFSAFILST
jgi:hypothetical protein